MKNKLHLEQRADVVDKLQTGSGATRRFPDWLEQDFMQSLALGNIDLVRMVLGIAVALFLLSGILDFFLTEDWRQTFWIRYIYTTPVLLSLLALAISTKGQLYLTWIIALSSLTLTLAMALMVLELGAPHQNLYYSGFILILLYAFYLCQQYFGLSLIIMVLVLLTVNITVWLDADKNVIHLVEYNIIFGVASALLIFQNSYRMQRLRKRFLQVKSLEITRQQLQRSQKQLKRLARKDGLTGLANRRHFMHHLQREWRRAVRYGYPISLYLMDFDYFKQYNDCYGHIAGDKALQILANKLAHFTRRPGDLAGRYGGDEFTLLLIDTEHDSAMYIAEQLREAVISAQIPHEGSAIEAVVTTTIGVATLLPQTNLQPESLLYQADQALLKAKNAGRNRVNGIT